MSQRITVQVYCRLTVVVEDPAAVTGQAVRQLREAEIDWAAEEDDLESAAAELGADLLASIAGLAEPDRMFDGVPGLDVRGGHVWAERGEPDPGFLPGNA
jgi:hypothetical protein